MLSKLNNWLGIIIMACIGVSSIVFWARGTLTLYIHPRYVFFTVAVSIVGVVVCGAAALLRDKHTHTHAAGVGTVTIIVIAIMMGALLILPPASLSYKLAQNRGAGYDTPAAGSRKISIKNGTENLNIEEWSSLIGQTVDLQKLAGKKAQFSGFVIPIEGSNDEFLAGKFVVTCCAVDARPATVRIKSEGWNRQFSADQWVRIDGMTRVENGTIVVAADTVELIGRPKNPYAN